VVVWLDEAQHYLTGPDRLTIATARVMLDPDQPMVLVATMWPQWYEQLATPPAADVPLSDHEDIDPHRHARQILATAARLIRLASFRPKLRGLILPNALWRKESRRSTIQNVASKHA
jgi:hypothetical protein